MNSVKHLRQLDPNCGQIVDIEKTPVIDFFGRDAPKREPIRLRVKQLIQQIETARVACLSIDLGQRLFDCLLHLRRFRTSTLETPFDDSLFANSFCNSFRFGFGSLRQIFERGQNALQFRVKIFLLLVGEVL